MSLKLKIILVLIGFAILFTIIRNVNKSRVITSDFTYWIAFILFLISLALIGNVDFFLSSLLGVHSPVNAIFLVVISLLIMLVLHLALRVSILNRRMIQLTQHLALSKVLNNNDKS